MSTNHTATIELSQSEFEHDQAVVCRDPFYLESKEGALFSWLHRRPDEDFPSHGVVICAPIGFEQLHAHRGLRHLADQLAQNHIPTLRFDWHGTGDSAGDDLDSNRYETWKANVRTAVKWMKDYVGCAHVSVIGLRMGATLASLALEHDEIENLVLWAPVANGRHYVREQSAIDMMSEARPQGVVATKIIEAAGFRLTEETATELSKCNLLLSKPDCRRILLASREDATGDQRLLDHFAGCGGDIEHKILLGLPEMLVEPHKSQLPEIAIEEIVSWLLHQFAVDATPAFDKSRASGMDTSAMTSHTSVRVDGTLIQEWASRFSQSPDLFGILSEPVDASDIDLPTIVLLNAGSAYRIGPGRMNVEMARQFSALGFRCLRFDLCGLGDSVTHDITEENDSYASTTFRDIRIALDALHARGSRRFVLMGLCSGAYASFQAAAQFTHPGLIESVLINPLTFFWCDGMSLETAPTQELIREHYYLNSAFQPSKWLKLLSGRSNIGVRGALRMITQRLGLTCASRSRRSVPESSSKGSTEPSHPQTEDLTRDLKRIVTAKRQLSIFFSTTDPGYSILTSQARRQAKTIIRSGQLNVTFISDADHTFSRQSARLHLIEAISAHLTRRYLVSGC